MLNAHPDEFLYDGSIWQNQEAWNEVGTWSQAAIEGLYDAMAHTATDSSKGVSPGVVGTMADWTETVGSISDYNDDLYDLFGKGAFRIGRGLPGPTGAILVGGGSFLKSIDGGDSWGRATYNAGVDIAYDAGVDFVAEAAGLLAGAGTIETGPGAVAFGTAAYVAVQLSAMALVDPVKDNIADQVYSAFTERASTPLDVDTQPTIYPFGYPFP